MEEGEGKKKGGNNLAYLITGEGAGRVCSLENNRRRCWSGMLLGDHDRRTNRVKQKHSTTCVALGTGAAIGNPMLATKQGQQAYAARESTKVCWPRVGLVRRAFILMSRRHGVPGAIAIERGERRSSCFWALQIGCAGRVPHSKSCVGVCSQGGCGCGRGGMEIEAFSTFTTSIMFKVDHAR